MSLPWWNIILLEQQSTCTSKVEPAVLHILLSLLSLDTGNHSFNSNIKKFYLI